MYTYENPEQVFGSFGAVGDWWETLPDETKVNIVYWISETANRQGLPVYLDRFLEAARVGGDVVPPAREVLSAFDRAPGAGGGFVVGDTCYCPPTSEGAASQQVTSSSKCPPGTGGRPLTQTINRKLFVSEQKVRVQPRPSGSDATKATIKGKVVGASGSGIAGAAVNVGPPGGGSVRVGMVASVVTGADGSFSVDVVPGSTGMVDVAVSAAGYVGATALGVVAIRGQTTTVLPISLTAVSPGAVPCDEGFIRDLVTAACVPVTGGDGGGGDGGGPPPITCPDGSVLAADGVTCVTAGGGFTCPVGYALAPDGVSCVAFAKKGVAKPWYKRTSTWLIIGGVVVVGVGGIVVASRWRR